MTFEKIYSLPIIKTIVYANVFISLCALAMVFTTYKVFSIPFNYQNSSYLLFIFLSTYLQYNVQRGYSIFKTYNLTERSLWVNKNKKALLITIGICLITILFFMQLFILHIHCYNGSSRIAFNFILFASF